MKLNNVKTIAQNVIVKTLASAIMTMVQMGSFIKFFIVIVVIVVLLKPIVVVKLIMIVRS